jgi:membrane protein implicated in regulation of membrane protease activity
MNWKKSFLLVFIVVILCTAAYVWFFIWNKPQTNVAGAMAIKTEAAVLFQEYSSNEKAANQKYLEKIVEVSGVVTDITKNAEGMTVVLLKTDDAMFGINCTMEQKEISVKAGDQITLKGICTGYLTDVVLIRCYLVN